MHELFFVIPVQRILTVCAFQWLCDETPPACVFRMLVPARDSVH
jgi:hypothetical protein